MTASGLHALPVPVVVTFIRDILRKLFMLVLFYWGLLLPYSHTYSRRAFSLGWREATGQKTNDWPNPRKGKRESLFRGELGSDAAGIRIQPRWNSAAPSSLQRCMAASRATFNRLIIVFILPVASLLSLCNAKFEFPYIILVKISFGEVSCQGLVLLNLNKNVVFCINGLSNFTEIVT